jgi:hypothetical protein
VFVLDARQAAARGFDRPEEVALTLSGVILHVLAPGDRFDVARRRLARAS